MDENTKYIVASNLTIAFYSNVKVSEDFKEESLFAHYEKFVSLLDARFGRREGEARPVSEASLQRSKPREGS